jgi:tRNA(fMet)-specific endonuclease VapC
MRILLDSDVVSHLLKNTAPASLLDRLSRIRATDKHVSVITVREVLYGIARRPHLEYLRRSFEDELLPEGVILPFDLEAARICADLQAELERQGLPLALPDLEIAAIALAHHLILITGNEKHFQRVPGLDVRNWLS